MLLFSGDATGSTREILLPDLVGRRSNSSFSASQYSCLKKVVAVAPSPKVNMWLGRIVLDGESR